MKKISSDLSWLYKQGLTWGLQLAVAIAGVYTMAINEAFSAGPVLILAGLLLVLEVFVYASGARRLLDSVHDAGSYLLVERRGRQERIALSEIDDVLQIGKDPGALGLVLRRAGPLGRQLKFYAQTWGIPGERERIADDLRRRAAAARIATP